MAAIAVLLLPWATANGDRGAKADAVGQVRDAAYERYVRGERYFSEQKYDQAIAAFQAAYNLSRKPGILVNLAQSRLLRGDQQLARFSRMRLLTRFSCPVSFSLPTPAEQVLAAAATDKRAAQALLRQFTVVQQAHTIGPDVRQLLAQVIVEIDRIRIYSAAELRGRRVAARACDTKLRQSRKRLRWAGMAAIGAGAILAAVGSKYGLDASRLAHQINQHNGPWTDELLDRMRQGPKKEKIAVALWGVGGAALVAGTVAYLYGRRPIRESARSSRQFEIVPAVSGELRGVGVKLRY